MSRMKTGKIDWYERRHTKFDWKFDKSKLMITGSDITQEQIDGLARYASAAEELFISCGWSFLREVLKGNRLGTLDGIDFSKYSNNESVRELTIKGLDGTIDLSPFTQPSSIIVSIDDTPCLCDAYVANVTFPDSNRLESLLIHGNVEHDRKTIPLLPSLKSLTYHSLRESDLSWLNTSKSITHVRVLRWVPEAVVLPSISSLESITFAGGKKRDPKTLKSIDLSPLRASKDLKEVIFSKQKISEVDFSPLSTCSKLEHISFEACNLTKVDLTPLEHLHLKKINLADNKINELVFPTRLTCESLDISGNMLETIDLTPIVSSSLREINLGSRHLVDIDLTPLSACTSLESLGLEHSSLESIDLSPLSGLKNLRSFRITSKLMSKVDITPLLSCPALKDIKFGKIKPVANRKMLKEIQSPRLRKMKKKIKWQRRLW
ncbi:MAG: leucine-rich repeat protein [Candidatus Thorarchaeota archaeon]